MIYNCRCGNFTVQSVQAGNVSPCRSEWLAVSAPKLLIKWPFLAVKIDKEIEEHQCCFYYCVLCSAWIVRERVGGSVVLLNGQYFDVSPKVATVGQHFKFLPDDLAVCGTALPTHPDCISQTEILEHISKVYLDNANQQSVKLIKKYEEDERANFQLIKTEIENQVEELTRYLNDAYAAVACLDEKNIPTESIFSEALLSPDDGFAQIDDEDPPREWREVEARSNDFTEADVFDSSDESNEAILVDPISQGELENDTLKPLPPIPGSRPTAVPMSINSVTTTAANNMSKSQPREIPNHRAYGRTAPVFTLESNDDNTGDEENVAKAIQMLARSIVSDGTELFNSTDNFNTEQE